MRFSLSTLVLLVLLFGLLMSLWFLREPWTLATTEDIGTSSLGLGLESTSPDETRFVHAQPMGWGASPTMIRFMDAQYSNMQSEVLLCELYVPRAAFVEGFKGNDTLILNVLKNDYENWTRDTYRRRFPEWWWGHFYRPEVWASVVLFIILIVNAVRSRKPRSSESALFPHKPADRGLPHRAGDGAVGPA